MNGELAVFEGQLKRGPTPLDTYYDRVDLSAWLKKGKNTIAILVWYFGKHGFSHNDSTKAGMVFQALVNKKQVLSDSTWKVKVHPAYSTAEKPDPNYRLSEANIQFNAQKDIPGWIKSGYDDIDWAQAEEPCPSLGRTS